MTPVLCASFPISTTHGLTGALAGAGLVAVGSQVNFATLGGSFFVPLLISPVLAVVLGALAYAVAHAARRYSGVTKEWCVCVGATQTVVAMTEPASFFGSPTIALPDVCWKVMPRGVAGARRAASRDAANGVSRTRWVSIARARAVPSES